MIRVSLRSCLVAAVATLAIGHAAAAEEKPCAHVGRALPSDPRVGAALAVQLHAPSARVLQSFTLRGWRILYVETPAADDAYVFFSGDPARRHYVTLWAGAAESGETESIRAWALENAPGIPPLLAACFADHVTRHRDM